MKTWSGAPFLDHKIQVERHVSVTGMFGSSMGLKVTFLEQPFSLSQLKLALDREGSSILNLNSHCRQQDILTSMNIAIPTNSVSVFLESRDCRILQSIESHSFNNGISKQDFILPECSK